MNPVNPMDPATWPAVKAWEATATRMTEAMITDPAVLQFTGGLMQVALWSTAQYRRGLETLMSGGGPLMAGAHMQGLRDRLVNLEEKLAAAEARRAGPATTASDAPAGATATNANPASSSANPAGKGKKGGAA